MKEFIGYKEALELTLANVFTGSTETLPLERLVGRVLAEDIVARVRFIAPIWRRQIPP